MNTMRKVILLLPLCIALPQALEARTLHVRTWGIDDVNCGTARHPCKSIVHAVGVAKPRDRVIVGPGEYVGTVFINKDGLRLESTAGAQVTTIRGDGVNVTGVGILADQVRLGRRGRGFTVLSPIPFSLLSRSVQIDGDRVAVQGIRTSGDRVGIRINGERVVIHECELSNHVIGLQMAAANGIARHNVIRGSTEIALHVQSSGIRIHETLAIDGATGIQDSGSGTRISSSVASGNSQDGIVLLGDGAILVNNVASGNGQHGFREVSASAAASLVGNTAEGNAESGFLLSSSDANGIRFRNNSTYNNAQCGLQYLATEPLTMRGNWWGTASPLSFDQVPGPADICITPGVTVNVRPSLRERPIRINRGL